MNAFSDKVKGSVIDDITPSGCSVTNGGVTGTAYGTTTSASVCKIIQDLEFGDFFALTNPLVLSGLLIGAMLPFLFAALTMLSVGKAATGIILEVRKELAVLSLDENWECAPEDKHIKPDVESCVSICTKASLGEMLLPGVLAVMTPIGVGLLVGARCLGGLLMGSIATGFLLAVMMNNAGGAWDNSKKYVENEGPTIKISDNKWEVVKKKHRIHKAVVTGDTVGDPFKDTSGPALNILIKLMSVLSLTCAGLFRDDWDTYWVGIIVLIVEAVACGIIFWYVWAAEEEQPDPKNIVKEVEVEMESSAASAASSEELDELKKQNALLQEEVDRLKKVEKVETEKV